VIGAAANSPAVSKLRENQISISEKVVNAHMGVYDNMAFGLKMRKFDKPDIAKRIFDDRTEAAI